MAVRPDGCARTSLQFVARKPDKPYLAADGLSERICHELNYFKPEAKKGVAVSVLLWSVLILLIIVIFGLLFALLTRHGSSCVLCDLLKRAKPEYGPVRAPPTAVPSIRAANVNSSFVSPGFPSVYADVYTDRQFPARGP